MKILKNNSFNGILKLAKVPGVARRIFLNRFLKERVPSKMSA